MHNPGGAPPARATNSIDDNRRPCRRLSFPAPYFHFYHYRLANTIMGHDIKTFKDAAELVLRVWRDASGFFLSIEVWLMVLVAGAAVGGFWLAVMGDAWSLPLCAFAFGYMPTRAILHARRILAWPFAETGQSR